MYGFVGGIAAVVALVLAGGTAARSLALPAPEDLKPNTVARISEVPLRFETVTIGELRHALVLAAAQEGLRSVPEPGRGGYGKLEKSAINALLETAWINGLAAEWGMGVTRDEVKRELGRVKKESFKSVAEFRRFLKESRYTYRDLYERVRLQILSTLLQERLQQMIPKGAGLKAEQKFFSEFVKEFNERWRARTVCAPQYLTERCSNGPLSVDQS